MASNRGVAYMGPGKVEIQSIDFPKLALGSRKCEHGVILKIVSTNICGSDQHMVRGRTTAPAGTDPRPRNHRRSDRSRPRRRIHQGRRPVFRCPSTSPAAAAATARRARPASACNVNPARPGAAYGYVDMGGWVGGQAEYVMVPYADFNLLKFPDKDEAMAKIKDLTLLSDIFPTGYHGAVTAGVGPGSIVYVAGGGPVGLACAASCHLLGAAVRDRRRHDSRAPGAGQELRLRNHRPAEGRLARASRSSRFVGVPEVDCAVDCVGFEARGHGKDAGVERPATVLNSLMTVTRAGGSIGIPGLYVTDDPGGVDDSAKTGNLSIRIGLGWAKSHTFTTGQCPVMSYQPAAHAGDSARQDSNRQGRQRHDDLARRSAAGLQGFRQGRGQEVRHRSAQDGGVKLVAKTSWRRKLAFREWGDQL